MVTNVKVIRMGALRFLEEIDMWVLAPSHCEGMTFTSRMFAYMDHCPYGCKAVQ